MKKLATALVLLSSNLATAVERAPFFCKSEHDLLAVMMAGVTGIRPTTDVCEKNQPGSKVSVLERHAKGVIGRVIKIGVLPPVRLYQSSVILWNQIDDILLFIAIFCRFNSLRP